jgi:hypothetical protein
MVEKEFASGIEREGEPLEVARCLAVASFL